MLYVPTISASLSSLRPKYYWVMCLKYLPCLSCPHTDSPAGDESTYPHPITGLAPYVLEFITAK
jgi:hypothetical protein